jgi:DNA-directed RNA polymerase subunit RPC12/RpoP
MVRANICYRCGKEMDGYYVEEGDLTITSCKIKCPHCGWTLEGAYDSYEDETFKPPLPDADQRKR